MCAAFVACEGEPVDLTPVSPSSTDAGIRPDATDTEPAPMVDMGATMMLYPDKTAFEEQVLPILVAQCGAGCHLGEIEPSNNDSPGGNDYEVSEEDIEGSLEELLHPSFSKPQEAAQSEVIIHHGGTYYRTLDEKRTVRAWIADTVIPKSGPGTTPTGPTELSCTHLPDGDGIGPTGWYDDFAANINPMLVGTVMDPVGYCTGSGCHTMVGVAGELNFLPITDPCSARWNFMVSQSFLNLENLTASPLLRLPLGEPTQDPNVSIHGGREVFKGQDANYTLLKQWITSLVF
jgi:hypothetical protein